MKLPRLLFFRRLLIYLKVRKFKLAVFQFRKWRTLVSDAVVLQYVGFETRGAVREYTFTLRGSGGESSEFCDHCERRFCGASSALSGCAGLLNRRHEAVLYAFDLLYLDGADLRQLALIERTIGYSDWCERAEADN